MGSFWEKREKEYYSKREASYIDDPNQIAWRSLAYGLVLVLFIFVFCPMMNKKNNKDIEEYKKHCFNSFYPMSIYARVTRKESYKLRDYWMAVQPIGSNSLEKVIIDCNCPNLRSIHSAVNVGDTILKPADTLLVKIFNSPKYEELNRYETFKKK